VTRFAITLEFDGTPFMGLQRQPHGPSVQQALEDAAHAVTGEDVTLFSVERIWVYEMGRSLMLIASISRQTCI